LRDRKIYTKEDLKRVIKGENPKKEQQRKFKELSSYSIDNLSEN